jgi:hypothetical protein
VSYPQGTLSATRESSDVKYCSGWSCTDIEGCYGGVKKWMLETVEKHTWRVRDPQWWAPSRTVIRVSDGRR